MNIDYSLNIDDLLYNSIPQQSLVYANQLTVQNWNYIINQLREQTNETVRYLKNHHSWLFGDNDSTGYYQDVLTNFNNINISLSSICHDIDTIKETINTLKPSTYGVSIEGTDYIIAEEDK